MPFLYFVEYENRKYYNKIIFKYVIFNEKFLTKFVCTVNSKQMRYLRLKNENMLLTNLRIQTDTLYQADNNKRQKLSPIRVVRSSVIRSQEQPTQKQAKFPFD